MRPSAWDLVYLAGGLAAFPYLAWRLGTDPRWREGFAERLGRVPPLRGTPRIWIHCASVGEVRAARPLWTALRREYPHAGLWQTANTASGRAAAADTDGIRASYAPLDWSACLSRFLRRVRPDLLILVEEELWPNRILACARAGAPVVIASARMTEAALRRYLRFGRRFPWRAIRRVCAQSGEHAERYRRAGVPAERICVAGNLKFDAPEPPPPLPDWTPRANERWVVAGSTHDPEERHLLDALRPLRAADPSVRLVLAPRHVERAGEVETLARAKGWTAGRSPREPSDVLVVDRMGILPHLWPVAHVAFVGGTFARRGGHNVLEPAAVGVPVVVGPDTENVRDAAAALEDAGVLECVPDPGGLADALLRAGRPERRARARTQGPDVVARGRGAVGRHLEEIRAFIGKGAHAMV